MESDNFTAWRKATYSHANGSCVDVATRQHDVGVRDTVQHGSGPVLRFPLTAWRTFIGMVKSEHASHLS